MATRRTGTAPAKPEGKTAITNRIPASAARAAAGPAKPRATKEKINRRALDPDDGDLKVRATRMGIYGEKRRREGNVFVLADKKDFRPSWMVWEARETPVSRTTARQALKQQHDEILGGTVKRTTPPADDEV